MFWIFSSFGFNSYIQGGHRMKDIRANIIFMLLGVIILLLETSVLKLNGTLGWLLTTTGVLLIGLGILYKSKNPLKVIAEFFMNLF